MKKLSKKDREDYRKRAQRLFQEALKSMETQLEILRCCAATLSGDEEQRKPIAKENKSDGKIRT